jgi:hypothetical protein
LSRSGAIPSCRSTIAGDHIPSDAVVPASLLATTRRQPAPGGRRGQDRDEGKLQVARPSSQLRRRLQFRSQSQDPQRPHAIPVHLQMRDFGPEKIQPGSTPSNAGTKQVCVAGDQRHRRRALDSPTMPRRLSAAKALRSNSARGRRAQHR